MGIKIGKIIKKCVVCGKTFTVYPYRTVTSKVCSYKCSGKIRMNKLKRICKSCGKLFFTVPSQLKYYKGAGKYCSMKCAYKGMIEDTKKKPIKDKYGRSNRKDDLVWKKTIREKYNNTCLRCGIYQKYIHTHHVATRARRPDLKHDISNGICLCNSCHTWVHNNIKKSEKLGYLSTEKYEKTT